MEPTPIIPLTGISFPSNFAWESGLCDTILDLHPLRWNDGAYRPPRFTGYFYSNVFLIGTCAHGGGRLPRRIITDFLDAKIATYTSNQHQITGRASHPDYLMVHDAWDGRCWLAPFKTGLVFLRAPECFD